MKNILFLIITSLILSLALCTNQLASPSYQVVNSGQPCLNYQNNQSIFTYNYNPSYLSLFNQDGSFNTSALMVRCQNATSQPFGVTPSKLSISMFKYDSDFSQFNFTSITEQSIVFEPESDLDNYGTEDPRIAYRELDKTYYMFYTAAQQYSNETVVARLAFATTQTPLVKESWIRQGIVFPKIGWSKSGALILRDNFPGSPHYLIWGDSNLTLAYSTDLKTFTNYEGFYLETRSDNFDSQLVESGPPPLQLTDGNYIFFYNSARNGFASDKPGYSLQYNPGYIIIDGQNPKNILQRCVEPLITPTLAWQTGSKPYLGLTPNVVFLEAAQSLGNNQFLVFYGAADSVIGSGLVTVTINENNAKNDQQYDVSFLKK